MINLQTHTRKVHYVLKNCLYDGEVDSQVFNWHDLAVQKRKQRICMENKRDRFWCKEILRTVVHRKQGSLTHQVCGCSGTWGGVYSQVGMNVPYLGIHRFPCRKVFLPALISLPRANIRLNPNTGFCLTWYTEAKSMRGQKCVFLEGLSRKVGFIHWILLHNCKVFKLIP